MSTSTSRRIRGAIIGSRFAGSTHAEAICYAPDDGLKSIAVVQAAHRAAAERTWVPVGAILEEG